MKQVFITDSDNWATDKNFEYLLWFQPSFWVMILWEDVLQIFLDPRYFQKTHTMSKTDIISQTGLSDLTIEFIELVRPFYENLVWFLQKEKEIVLSPKASFWFYEELKKEIYIHNPEAIITCMSEDVFVNKRVIKTDDEIGNITQAIHIIDTVFLYIKSLNDQWKLIGMTEKDVRTIIINKIFENWWDGESFEALVAFWKNSAIPHHFAWDDIIWEWVLLIDMWAVYKWYCSDFTRTFWVYNNSNQEVSKAKKENYDKFTQIYAVVKHAHKLEFSSARSWMTGEEIDWFARNYIKEQWYEKNFQYSWHGIWMDVHEWPKLSPKQDNIIEDWMVFTIEPWIHLEWEFGIRIEDIVFMKEWRLKKVTNVWI